MDLYYVGGRIVPFPRWFSLHTSCLMEPITVVPQWIFQRQTQTSNTCWPTPSPLINPEMRNWGLSRQGNDDVYEVSWQTTSRYDRPLLAICRTITSSTGWQPTWLSRYIPYRFLIVQNKNCPIQWISTTVMLAVIFQDWESFTTKNSENNSVFTNKLQGFIFTLEWTQ